jgi:hypothetical protein
MMRCLTGSAPMARPYDAELPRDGTRPFPVPPTLAGAFFAIADATVPIPASSRGLSCAIVASLKSLGKPSID